MPELNMQVTQIPYEDMLKAGMHFGRKRTVFNPAMERDVFTRLLEGRLEIVDEETPEF